MRRPEPTDPRDPHAKTWTWKAGIGKDATHQILHIESGVLYSVQNIASASQKDSLLRSLGSTHPVAALQPVDMLPVDGIKELRVAPSVRIVEIDHGDRVPFTMLGVEFGEELFAAVQRSRTAQFRIEQGTISVWNAVQLPLVGLMLVTLIGGLFTYLLWTAVNPIEPLKYLVPGLTIILDLLCLGLLIQRIISPPVATILKSV